MPRCCRSPPIPACARAATTGCSWRSTRRQWADGRCSDGPDTVEELMRNTRNNPLEDLGMHLPLICDRYEVRDDVPPGAGKFRGGAGVVKSQRYLTPGFMTHESDRNEDAPWGIFGGKPGHVSKVESAEHPDRQGQLPAGEVLRPAHRGGRRRHLLLAVRRRLRRSAGARPGTRCSTTCSTASSRRSRARRLRRGARSEVDDGYGWALDGAATRARARHRWRCNSSMSRDFVCRAQRSAENNERIRRRRRCPAHEA